MIEIIEFQGHRYPKFQSDGNAARFCRPFALEVCKRVGFDIGYSREEWKFPGAIKIKPSITPEFHAMNLPNMQVDYIHSSHMLEHYEGSWVQVLDYWVSKLRVGGVLFLYLPDYSQRYWRPFNNRKHVHCFEPKFIRDYMEANKSLDNVFVSGVDMYNGFTAMAERVW